MKKALALLLLAVFTGLVPAVHAEQDFVIAGSTYPFPDEDDTDWGENVTNWASAVTTDLNNKTILLRNATTQILATGGTNYAPSLPTAASTAALTTWQSTFSVSVLDQSASTQTKLGTLWLRDRFIVGAATGSVQSLVLIGTGTESDISNPAALKVLRTSGTTVAGIILDGTTDAALRPLKNSAVWLQNNSSTFAIIMNLPGSVERFRINTASPNIVMTGAVTVTGDLHITGNMAAASKTFKFPHPLHSDRWLVHGNVESNKHGLTYDGMAQLQNGEIVIDLPSYFESICAEDGRTVQLTPTDGWSPLYVDGPIANGRFTVKTIAAGSKNQRFYWQLNGKRGDPSVNGDLEIEPYIVEGEMDQSSESEKSGFDQNEPENRENAIKRLRSKFSGFENEAKDIIQKPKTEEKR